MGSGRRRVATALCGVALLSGACGTRSSTGGAPAPARVLTTDGVATATTTVATERHGHVCLDQPAIAAGLRREPVERPRLPAGPIRGFVRCRIDDEKVPGEGQWEVLVEERSVAGAGALAAALRRPDEALSRGACTAYADLDPDLWALDASGRALLVHVPRDGCSHIQPRFAAAFAAATWRESGRRRLRLMIPQAALDTGCAEAYSDMAGVEAADHGSGSAARPGSFHALRQAPTGRVCVYRLTEGGAKPNGPFERGRRLDQARWNALVTLLEATPASSGGCSALPRTFAIVLPGGDGDDGAAYVELGGCRRTLTPDGGHRTATPALLASLTSR